MELNISFCQDQKAAELITACRKNFSDDCDPFHMSQLVLYTLESKSPVTKQTIEATLDLFILNQPEGIFKDHFSPHLFNKEGGLKYSSDWYLQKKTDFENRLKGCLSEYREQVRSPIPKNKVDFYLNEVYAYLGKPKFFLFRGDLFKTVNYYCDNINAIIVTQNHGKYPTDKLAMFSFFCPD